MSVPQTYLLTAPSDADNTFGRAIMSTDLLRGLKKINPRIRAWEQFPDGVWWPGKKSGLTTLWVGEPGGDSQKISGFTQGPIPEFTQVAPDGDIICKGWREIFRKCIKVGAATQQAIENRFKVDLGTEGNDGSCKSCRADGKVVKGDNASGLCNLHEHVRLEVWRAKQLKDEIRYRRKKGQDSWHPTQSPANNSQTVFLTTPSST